MRAALLVCCAFFPACAGSSVEPLLVGPGPCTDQVSAPNPETGLAEHGCLSVPLVEATREANGAGVTVRGRVLVAGSLEPLPGANVIVVGDEQRGTTTQVNGRFRLDSLRPSDRLAIRFVGFWPDTLDVGALPGPRRTP